MGCSVSASACSTAEFGTTFSTKLSRSSGASAGNFHDKFKLGVKLGEGTFGQVLKATACDGGESVAVKVLDFRSGNSLSGVKEEVFAWQLVSGHESVVQLHEAFFENKLGYLVCELCTCTVMDMLAGNTGGGEPELAKVFRGMLFGLAHVHKADIIHRDVKPDNFLLGGPEGQTVKLADFGMAVPLPKSGFLRETAGTAPYMSLQMVRGEGYNLGADIWSMGVVAYLMLFGEFPFGRTARNSEQMKRAIAKGEPPLYRPADAILATPSREAIAFARGLIVRRPLQRPSAVQALELPFVTPAACVEAHSELEVDAPVPFELQPVVRKAQKLTTQLRTKPKVNPTVQRDLDELLRRLQGKHKSEVAAGAPRLTRSFSGEARGSAFGDIWDKSAGDHIAEDSEDTPMLARRRLKRSLTHTGFTPTTTLDSLPPLSTTLDSLPPLTCTSADDDGERSVCSVSSDSDVSTASGGVGFFDARSNCTASNVPTLDALPPLQMPSMPKVPEWSGPELKADNLSQHLRTDDHKSFLAPSMLKLVPNGNKEHL